MSHRFLALTALLVLALGGSVPAPASAGTGVLVMAHGGGAEWNQGVLDSVASLAADRPVEVAFGMADPCTLQEAVRKLEASGADRAVVVRLFVSGESFLRETEQILGLQPGAPEPAADACAHAGGGHSHSTPAFRIPTRLQFVLSSEGLSDAPEMGDVLAERAKALSEAPASEEVLILAHGPGDDAENERWIAAIDQRAERVRAALPFHRVTVHTLREDWPEKRAVAEAQIRAAIESAAAEGRKTIVIPFRVQGFGPYAKVLEGLSYVSDGRGLVPHPHVAAWIARQVEELSTPATAAPATGTSQPVLSGGRE
jgi:predicted alpha/beta-hydrolase family hydrolase